MPTAGVAMAMERDRLAVALAVPDSVADAELLQRFVKHRDTDALELLFRRHAPAAYRFASRLLDNHADAEDAVQAAFVDVIRLAPQFRGGSSVKAWILGNVISSCRHKTREEARRETRELRSAQMTDRAAAAAPIADVADAETKTAARRAVEALPEHYRLPIWLQFFEGLSAAEAAVVLQSTENTVRSQVRRGLDALRVSLAANGCVLSASALPALLASIPAQTVPATVISSLAALAKTGGLAASAAPAAKAASAGKTVGGTALKMGLATKLTVGVVTAVTLAAGGKMVLSQNKAAAPAPVPTPLETKADGEKSATTAPAGGTQLGALNYQPSPEHIVGWRGDGSGRYTGATPPTVWSRVAKTIIREFRCQGSKPKSAESADGAQALPFGNVSDWLVLGPFPYEDPAKAFDEEFISGEADAAPTLGDKVAGKEWQRFEAGGKNQHGNSGQTGVEFAIAYGELPKAAAYANTNVYAPVAGKVSMSLVICMGMKVWLNGKPIYNDPKAPYGNNKSLDVELNKGWNHLLFKVMGGNSIYDKQVLPAWRVAVTLHSKETSVAYETKNIQWMTPMPAGTTSLPLIVGDKIITQSNYSDLVCVSKSTGKILWMHPNYRYDIMTDAEKAAHPQKDKIEPEVVKLKALNDALFTELNTLVSTTGLPTDKYQALCQRLADKDRQERKICGLTVGGGGIKRNPCDQHCGTSNGTPCCDGTHIYAVFGGGVYSGPLSVVCYDLDGKRIWAYGIDDTDASEHGVHSSPLLIGGKLIISSANTIFGIDAKTGAEVWRGKPGGTGKNFGASPIPLKIGGTDVIFGGSGDMVRVSDGKRLWNPDQVMVGNPFLTPICDNGVIYHCGGWAAPDYISIKVPETAAEELKPTITYRAKLEAPKTNAGVFSMGHISSPLLHEGLLYYVTEGGALSVVDAATGQTIYTQVVEDFHARTQWVFYPGVCCSPTLAGKYIYMMDDCGTTVVLEPGREFKKVAANPLENLNNDIQEQTLSTPIFEGNRMYFRSPGYLFCIGEK